MNHEVHVHRAPSQTTTDIYAARPRFSPKRVGDGCWHQWTIALTLDGFCRWQSLEDGFTVSAGHITITQPRTWMYWKVGLEPADAGKSPVEVGWDCAYAVFHPRPHWGAWLDAYEYRSGMAHIIVPEGDRKEVARAMNGVVVAYRRGGSMRDAWALNELERVLMRIYALNPRSRVAQDPRVCEAVDFIGEHFARRLTVEDIAAAVHLSVSHLSTLFTAAMGAAPSAYIERIRLERAAEMLRFGAAGVAEIAEASGYSDPEYFSRRFRIQYGQTPREYRNAARPRVGAAKNRRAAGEETLSILKNSNY